jgi:phosphoglycerol transferase
MVYLSLVPAVGGRERSGLFAAWLLITPITAYTAYFMPESTYGLFFAFLAWTVVRVLPARTLAGAALAGAIVGAMLLIKPHALALVAAMGLTFAAMAVAPRRLRPAPATVAMAAGICAASCYATLVALNLLLSGHLQFHSLTFVGGVYRPVLAGTSPVAWFERPRALVTILAAHVIVLGALLSPALGIAAGQMQRWYAGRHDAAAETRDRRLYLLICFAAAVALATVGMTTVFSMFVEQSSDFERLRLHGRYYSFFLPLFFLVYFAVLSRPAVGSGQARGDRWLRGGANAGAAMAAMLLYLHGTRVIFPFDFPEAFVFSSWAGRPRVGLVKTLALGPHP